MTEARTDKTRASVAVLVPTLDGLRNLPHVFARLATGASDVTGMSGRTRPAPARSAWEARR